MIGYYVHHHGGGHLARAASVCTSLDEPVVALSSMPEPDTHPFAGWVALPADPPLPDADDPTAGGALHWAPRNGAGYAERMAAVARWVTDTRPRLVVVDVSVEVSTLVRLLGVPVVVVALPGTRDEPAHRLAYDVASRVLAPWPRSVYAPAFLRRIEGKVVYTGAFSRFDDRAVSPARHDTVLVLLGAGGAQVGMREFDELARASGRDCAGLGGADLPWSADVWSQLCRAEVVVTHAGLSCLAEVAAARRPTVLVPQERPFDEQSVTAHALQQAGIATTVSRWPAAADWEPTLATALRRGGAAWARWNDGRGAQRFAAALTDVA